MFSPEYSVCYRYILSEWSKNYPTITPARGERKEFLLINLNKKKGITECCAELKFDKRYCHGQTCQCGLMPSPQPSPTGREGKD
jgi:hypothetical protein